MGRGFRVFHKLPPDRETPYSVIMESKQQEDTLMFESGAVVVLCKLFAHVGNCFICTVEKSIIVYGTNSGLKAAPYAFDLRSVPDGIFIHRFRLTFVLMRMVGYVFL